MMKTIFINNKYSHINKIVKELSELEQRWKNNLYLIGNYLLKCKLETQINHLEGRYLKYSCSVIAKKRKNLIFD